jgi:type VI secretion system secreted protein VgrG
MATQKKKANEAQFYFFCGGVPAETFEVINFSGRDEVSQPYCFDISAISANTDISAEDVINKPATLYIYRDEEYCPYSGIVTAFEFASVEHDRATYRITLEPKLRLMDLNLQTRIFQKIKAPDIVKKVLDDAGLSNYATFDIAAGSYPELEYVVQYQESDLNFISRLLESNGIWYFFKESSILSDELDGSNGIESMIITDKAASFKAIDSGDQVIFRTAGGMAERIDDGEKESISAMHRTRQMVPKEVMLKDYNYRTPEVSLTGKSSVDKGDVGTVYEYGRHFKNTSEASTAAKVGAGRALSRRILLEGTGNCRGFRAGSRFTLKEHPTDNLNGTYVLLVAHHSGSHNAASAGAAVFTYANRFECIPSAQADSFRPAERAVRPRINGIMTAQIEANGSDYASIDDSGRYKIRLPFDTSGTGNYEGSRYIRLAQPYSGANYGMHFPSHEGAEMVLAHVDGNPDRPLGLATIPNGNTLPPVVSTNQQQNIIRTAGGNELLLDDTDSKQRARLLTKAANTLDMDDDQKRIVLQTTNANSLLLDDQNEVVTWTGKSHTITMNYASGSEAITITSAGGHVIKIDDNGKALSIQTSGGNNITLDDNNKKIVLADSQSKNKVTLDGNSGLMLESQGKIVINATQDLELTGANIKMTGSSGTVDVKATSDLTLGGTNVTAKADMNLNAKASMNVAIEGSMGVDIKSSMQTKVHGMMAEFSGDTMTTIKGGIVMIN